MLGDRYPTMPPLKHRGLKPQPAQALLPRTLMCEQWMVASPSRRISRRKAPPRESVSRTLRVDSVGSTRWKVCRTLASHLLTNINKSTHKPDLTCQRPWQQRHLCGRHGRPQMRLLQQQRAGLAGLAGALQLGCEQETTCAPGLQGVLHQGSRVGWVVLQLKAHHGAGQLIGAAGQQGR